MEPREIDAIARQFEDIWEPQLPIEQISAFEPIRGIEGAALSELLLELSMIDIERRWMLFQSMLSEGTTPESLVQMLQAIPTGGEYVAIFNAERQLIGEEAALKLHIHEFSVRVQLGDLPHPNPCIPTHIIDELTMHRPRVFVAEAGAQRFCGSTWGRVQVGRQNPPEPPPYTLMTLPNRSKLICAVAGNSRISRKQFTVQVFASRLASLHNTSKNRHLIFRTELRAEPLAPGDQCILPLPCTVHLDAIEVSFRCF